MMFSSPGRLFRNRHIRHNLFAIPLFAVGIFVFAFSSVNGLPQAVAANDSSVWMAQEADLSKLKVGDSVKLKLRTGGQLKGIVEELADREIRIRTKFGANTVKRDDVISFELFKSNQTIFDERSASCKNAQDWLKLAEWAKSAGEPALRDQCYENVIKIDPDNAIARKGLGEVKHEGKWLPEEEAMVAKGLKFYDGEWRTPEEIEKLEAKREADLRKKAGAGALAKQDEYRGRPYAEAEPIITQHYNIYCWSTEEVARRYAKIMELLYDRYQRVFSKTHFKRRMPIGRTRSDVWIYANHQQFMDWTGVQAGVGGFFRTDPRLHDVTAYHGSFGTSGSTEEVLAHEGTHQFQAMIFKNFMAVPSWTIEGMAVYFGDGSEIGRNEVKINIIPRDRLLGLQAAMEDGTYCNLQTLLRLSQRQFTGFHYGHGWGVFYWCFWGDKHKYGWKKKDGTGHKIMEEWLLYCRDIGPQMGQIQVHAKKFNDILQAETGMTPDEWEAQYKNFIMGLTVESIVKKKGSTYSSEKLGFQANRPSGGWKAVRESKLGKSESLAFKSGTKRISTYAMANWAHSKLDAQLAAQLAGQIFQNDRSQLHNHPMEWTKESVYGVPALVSIFKGKKISSSVGGNVGGGTEKGEEMPERVFKIVVYATIDKMYANIIECEEKDWPRVQARFNTYLEKFKIIY